MRIRIRRPLCLPRAGIALLGLLAAAGPVQGQAPGETAPQARAQPASAPSLRLGEIDFPTSARSAEAQRHFLRGVAALHSFWYPVARDAFRQAAEAEPGFAMAHWGEAMTHDHPVWGDPQDTAAGRAALARIDADAPLSARERGYVEAARRLYGDGELPARRRAHAEAMAVLHARFPRDAEAALFHSLALLGLGEDAARLRAGEIALGVLGDHPRHPGAAHYAIHAYDDPRHARQALPAAQRYADIAPDSAHALHMPSHVFVQLGMWREAARSNERAWQASLQPAGADGAHPAEPDIHSLHWLLYAYLQQGRHDDARGLLQTMRETLARQPKTDPHRLAFATWTQATMAATWLVETGRWEEAPALLGPDAAAAGPAQGFVALARSPATFARGLAAARAGDAPQAAASAEQLRSLQVPPEAAAVPYVAAIVETARVQARVIDAAAAAGRQDHAQALRVAREVVQAAASMPPPVGPPRLVKPPHELLADIALAAGEADVAGRHYRIALDRTPGRAHALLGAARAAAAAGDEAAARRLYADLRRQWRGVDEPPPLRP